MSDCLAVCLAVCLFLPLQLQEICLISFKCCKCNTLVSFWKSATELQAVFGEGIRCFRFQFGVVRSMRWFTFVCGLWQASTRLASLCAHSTRVFVCVYVDVCVHLCANASQLKGKGNIWAC